MRGPGLRLPLEVRRTWRCPRCAAERKVPGDVVQVRCLCVPDGVTMKLVQEPVSAVLRSLNPKPRHGPEPKRSGDLPPRKPLEDEPVPPPVAAAPAVLPVEETSPEMAAPPEPDGPPAE